MEQVTELTAEDTEREELAQLAEVTLKVYVLLFHSNSQVFDSVSKSILMNSRLSLLDLLLIQMSLQWIRKT
jgi:hypothetical protein